MTAETSLWGARWRVCGSREHQLRLSGDAGAEGGRELRGATEASGSLDRQSLG